MKLCAATLVIIGLLGFLFLMIIPTEQLQDPQDLLHQNLLYIVLALVVIIAFGWAILDCHPSNGRQKAMRKVSGA